MTGGSQAQVRAQVFWIGKILAAAKPTMQEFLGAGTMYSCISLYLFPTLSEMLFAVVVEESLGWQVSYGYLTGSSANQSQC